MRNKGGAPPLELVDRNLIYEGEEAVKASARKRGPNLLITQGEEGHFPSTRGEEGRSNMKKSIETKGSHPSAQGWHEKYGKGTVTSYPVLPRGRGFTRKGGKKKTELGFLGIRRGF